MTVYTAVLNGQFQTIDVRVFKSKGAAKIFQKQQLAKGREYEIFANRVETMDDLVG